MIFDIENLPPQPKTEPKAGWIECDWYDRPLALYGDDPHWANELRTKQWVITFSTYWATKQELCEWLGISPLRLKHAIGRLKFGKHYSKRGKKAFNDGAFRIRKIDGKECLLVDRNILDRLIEDQHSRYPLPSLPAPQSTSSWNRSNK